MNAIYDHLTPADLMAIEARISSRTAGDADGAALLREVRRLRLSLALVLNDLHDVTRADGLPDDKPIGFCLTQRAVDALDYPGSAR